MALLPRPVIAGQPDPISKEYSMLKSIIIAGVVMLPVAAFAQSTDAKYCNDMSLAYRNFTNNIDAEATRAMTQCRTDPAAAIPVLEKHLKENKIPLPARN